MNKAQWKILGVFLLGCVLGGYLTLQTGLIYNCSDVQKKLDTAEHWVQIHKDSDESQLESAYIAGKNSGLCAFAKKFNLLDDEMDQLCQSFPPTYKEYLKKNKNETK